jgi:hypothetical protein
MSTGLQNNCCTPQKLSINNSTGYLSISDGNSVFLGTLIKSLGIKTPVINFSLDGYILTLIYTDQSGAIQTKDIDLSALAQGGSFTANNTPSITLTYSNGNLNADSNISQDPNNSITVNPDGLFVPVSNQIPLTANDSTTIDFTTSGINNMTLTASVKVSVNPSNKIQIASDGLLVQDMTTYILQGNGILLAGSGSATDPYILNATAASQTPLSVSDSSSFHFISSGTNGMNLTGNVKISAQGANALILNADGLYVPQASAGGYTDAQARHAISATAPILYNNVTGVISEAQASSTASGYLANTDFNNFSAKIGTGASVGTSSSLPIYAGQTGTTLNYYGLRAGTNVSIVQSGNDLVISSSGSGGSASTVFSLDFIVGDGGLFTPTANASQFNPPGNPLVGKTILGFWVEGVKTAGVPRSGGELYYTFVQSTGTLTLTNGVFSQDTYYSILYK